MKKPSKTTPHEQRLEQWIHLYSDILFKVCFMNLSDRSLAEDALQDTFLKAWKSLDRFEASSPVNERAWLCRIAINTCRDYQRSKWFRHIDLRRELNDLAPNPSPLDPADTALFEDICQLPSKLKHVLILYYYQDMTLREIATILNLSLGTVHHRLKKAESLLKLSLEGD